jgi:hypothetical protein
MASCLAVFQCLHRRHAPGPDLISPCIFGKCRERSTASATTQFSESLITETLREKPALARPIRRVVLVVRSLAGGICRIWGPVSGRKNPVPGAMMPFEENAQGVSPSLAYCSDHSAGASRRFAMPTPRGRRASTAACTRFGARNASEIVILI